MSKLLNYIGFSILTICIIICLVLLYSGISKISKGNEITSVRLIEVHLSTGEVEYHLEETKLFIWWHRRSLGNDYEVALRIYKDAAEKVKEGNAYVTNSRVIYEYP